MENASSEPQTEEVGLMNLQSHRAEVLENPLQVSRVRFHGGLQVKEREEVIHDVAYERLLTGALLCPSQTTDVFQCAHWSQAFLLVRRYRLSVVCSLR